MFDLFQALNKKKLTHKKIFNICLKLKGNVLVLLVFVMWEQLFIILDRLEIWGKLVKGGILNHFKICKKVSLMINLTPYLKFSRKILWDLKLTYNKQMNMVRNKFFRNLNSILSQMKKNSNSLVQALFKKIILRNNVKNKSELTKRLCSVKL